MGVARGATSTKPPLGPGRGNYVRGYSYSIVGFAARCLYLNEMLEEAVCEALAQGLVSGEARNEVSTAYAVAQALGKSSARSDSGNIPYLPGPKNVLCNPIRNRTVRAPVKPTRTYNANASGT